MAGDAGAKALSPPPGLSVARASFWTSISPRGLLIVGLFLLVACLTLVPLVTVVVSSFRPDGLPLSPGWTADHYTEVWSAAYTWRLLGNSLLFAGASAGLALIIGLALAWLIERTDIPLPDLFRAAILMPMATPPLLLAIGWALVMSPQIGLIPMTLKPLIGPLPKFLDIYSLGGAIFVQGLAYVPTCFLMLSPAIRAIDPAFEEAALMSCAPRPRVFVAITLPFLLPTLLSLATILVMVGMLAFDVPAVIGIPGNVELLSIEVFRLMTPSSGLPEYGAGAALSSAVFVVMVVGLVVYRRVLRHADRFATVTGKSYRPARLALGRWRALAAGFVSLYVLAAIVLPLAALLWTSVTPYLGGFDMALLPRASFKAYGEVLTSPRVWGAALNTLIIAVACSAALIALAVAVAWVILRSGLRAAAWLDVIAMIPTGVPPLMMSVALIFIAFSIRSIPIYGTIWLIALGHVIIYLPVACRMMQAGLVQINAELEQAAHVAGASHLQALRLILLPLLKPTVIAIVIWVAVHSIREFSIAVMLQSGRNTVVSTILYNFWQNGNAAQAAAIAVMMMIGLCVMVAISAMITRRQQAT